MSQLVIAIALWCSKPTASADMTMTARQQQQYCREEMIKCVGDVKKFDDKILECAIKITP